MGKVLRQELYASVVRKGIGDANVEGIIADRDLDAFDLRIAERIMPVIDMIHLDALPRPHGRRTFTRTGTGRHHKRVIIGDLAVLPLTAQRQPHLEGLTWALA